MIPLIAIPKSFGDRVLEYVIICAIIGVLIVIFQKRETIKKFLWGSKMRKIISSAVAVSLVVTGVMFVNHKIDEAKRRVMSPFCDTPRIMKEAMERLREASRKKAIKFRSTAMQIEDKKAHELCDLFPEEQVCQYFHDTINCNKDYDCMDRLEDSYYTESDDVIACFIHKDDELDNDYIFNLPYQCDSFHTISIRNLISDEPLIPIGKVEDMPPEIKEWADKVTPGHVAGIATGIKMILQSDEELKELSEEAIPSLDAIIALGGNDMQSANQSAGIMIGLYNAGISMADNHVEIARNTNRENCNSYSGQDVVPIRCFTPNPE